MPRLTPFGMSALSRYNRDIAYNNEIMCEKNLGEMLVKSSTGDTISYNYFTRLSTSIDELTISSTNFNKLGSIYSITPTDTDLPSLLRDNVLPTSCTLPDSGDGLIISMDLTAIKIATNEISTDLIDKITAKYTVSYVDKDNVTHTIQKELLTNNMVYDYIDFGDESTSIGISDITLELDTEEDYAIILNNILVFVS